MVADFREVLMIRCTDDLIGTYMYTWAKYDLAISDAKPVETKDGFNLTLGEACQIIDKFTSDSLFGRKLNIKVFLETNKLTHTEEY